MVPREFRSWLDVLGEQTLYVTNALGRPRRLEVRPASSFRDFQARIAGAPWRPELEKFQIFYFGAAERVEMDRAGRILLPAELRRSVGLGETAVFVGVDRERFQIWRPEDLEAFNEQCVEEAEAIQEALASALDGSPTGGGATDGTHGDAT